MTHALSQCLYLGLVQEVTRQCLPPISVNGVEYNPSSLVLNHPIASLTMAMGLQLCQTSKDAIARLAEGGVIRLLSFRPEVSQEITAIIHCFS